MPEWLGGVATFFSALFFLVSAWQVAPFWKQGSVGDCSPLPFLATHVNAVLWLKYGLLRDDWPVSMVNGLGTLSSIVALLVFYRFALDRATLEARLLECQVGMAGLLLGHQLGWLGDGWIAGAAMASTLLMFTVPLLALPQAWAGKPHPFNWPMALTTLCLSLLWAAYGWRRHDPVIVGPQLVGLVVASAQLGVLAWWGPSNKQASTLPSHTVSPLLPLSRRPPKEHSSQEPL